MEDALAFRGTKNKYVISKHQSWNDAEKRYREKHSNIITNYEKNQKRIIGLSAENSGSHGAGG